MQKIVLEKYLIPSTSLNALQMRRIQYSTRGLSTIRNIAPLDKLCILIITFNPVQLPKKNSNLYIFYSYIHMYHPIKKLCLGSTQNTRETQILTHVNIWQELHVKIIFSYARIQNAFNCIDEHSLFLSTLVHSISFHVYNYIVTV